MGNQVDFIVAGTCQDHWDRVIRSEKKLLQYFRQTWLVMRATRICRIGKTRSADKDTARYIMACTEKPPMINVYPNPVRAGASINIGCGDLKEGYYLYRLLSLAGQQIDNKQIWIDRDATIINVEMPAVKAGVYIIILSGKETAEQHSARIIIR